MVPGVPLAENVVTNVVTGNKNRCVTEAKHVLRRKLRLRVFSERVCLRILSLESVDYSGTSKHLGGGKKRILISKRLTGRVL